jgi:hypothetical protein
MLTDILNGFQPAQFFMDSPLWVVFVVPGIINALKKYITAPILSDMNKTLAQDADDMEPSESAASCLEVAIKLFIIFLINLLYVGFLTYTAVPALTHHGVASGFPFILGVVLLFTAAELVSAIIRGVLKFIYGLVASMLD